MKGGFLIYKCRKCGAEVKNTHVPDVQLALILIINGDKLPAKWGGNETLHGIHTCNAFYVNLDKRNFPVYGVTDLIGGEEDKT